jgi:hypothetical protein
MNIQKLLLTSLILALGFNASAQNKSGTSFGIRAGFGYQNINGKDQNGANLEFDMVPRFNGGLVVEIPIGNQFYIQPSLLYTTKGAEAKDNYLGLPMSTTFNLSYIELPINFLYKPTLGSGNLLLGFGPYLSYGIGGNAEYIIDGITSEEKIEYTSEYSSANPFDQKYFKPMDYGGNILFGYQFAGGLSAQLNAQLGLAQIKAENTLDPNSQVEFKNTGFGISLGYMF